MLTNPTSTTRAVPRTMKNFANDYRQLQQKVSDISGEKLPPCFFCSAEQLWHCSQSGYECKVFKAYAVGRD